MTGSQAIATYIGNRKLLIEALQSSRQKYDKIQQLEAEAR